MGRRYSEKQSITRNSDLQQVEAHHRGLYSTSPSCRHVLVVLRKNFMLQSCSSFRFATHWNGVTRASVTSDTRGTSQQGYRNPRVHINVSGRIVAISNVHTRVQARAHCSEAQRSRFIPKPLEAAERSAQKTASVEETRCSQTL